MLTTAGLMTACQFNASLARDVLVEARWSSAGHRYVAQARVVKVNAHSLLVALQDQVDASEHHYYPVNHLLRLPRYASHGYSAHNGAYPVRERTC